MQKKEIESRKGKGLEEKINITKIWRMTMKVERKEGEGLEGKIDII